MANVDYTFVCSSCGKKHTYQFECTDGKKELIERGDISIKEITERGTFQREVFISGMCYDCQEKVFHRPAPGHEEAWGNPVAECTECGCPLYQKDVDEKKCPQCGCTEYDLVS